MDRSEQQLCGASGVDALVESLASKMAENIRPSASLALVGIHSRGVPLARRLAAELQRRWDRTTPIAVGSLDITLYRDDLDQNPHWPVLNATNIPFSVDGREIVLVDDVLFTGRTIRAALNAICDLGRPSRIRLAVAVDRGHRELPIAADFVGLTLETSRDQRVLVRLTPTDLADEIIRVSMKTEGANS